MALTPEDVVNKRFQPTKFREGYDQDEVDDFLDEIVVELRRLTQENEQLRQRVSELGGTDVETGSVPAPVAAAPATETAAAPAAETTPVTGSVDEAAEEATPEVAEAPATEQTPTTPEAPVAAAAPSAEMAAAGSGSAESAAGVLAMAQRLHDEYVGAGVEQRDKIIADAQMQANKLVSEAEEKSTKTLNSLEDQKSVLERKLDQLRGFERDYRARLKSYIEGQLQDLESQGPIATPDSKDNA
ncbi:MULTISPECIES: DivIVA domain-containing protein [Micrococcaceae]|uniref:Cell wall synthesis protein Wag31 n=1 Tax=Arthrobacter rhombi TaxID=71253 RepID=A0A1R4GMY9_9MICC|nr:MULTISPECIES: DivIVA domain-containing protein [Micrococcaceae]PCC26277.1 DivIVA domain-containing protein [Glutamicibacter sp. BW78]SJM69568.1 Possibly a cell division protein, antigen 84 in Mycobacteria [Arthrobacter rhombi]